MKRRAHHAPSGPACKPTPPSSPGGTVSARPESDLRHLNLAALWPQLPTTVLGGQLHVQPVQPAQAGAAQADRPPRCHPSTRNKPDQLAGACRPEQRGQRPRDQGRLPVTALQIDTLANAQGWMSRLQLRVGQGSVQGQGRWRTGGPRPKANSCSRPCRCTSCTPYSNPPWCPARSGSAARLRHARRRPQPRQPLTSHAPGHRHHH